MDPITLPSSRQTSLLIIVNGFLLLTIIATKSSILDMTGFVDPSPGNIVSSLYFDVNYIKVVPRDPLSYKISSVNSYYEYSV